MSVMKNPRLPELYFPKFMLSIKTVGMKAHGRIHLNPIHRDLLLVIAAGMVSAAVFVAAGFLLAIQL
ncbi:MAG: hypothetical protein AB7K37_15145 [Cyclobacteriaceae bacterium]